MLGLPPVITIAGERPECRQCELEGSLCLLFGLGKSEVTRVMIFLTLVMLPGSFKACTVLGFLTVPGGQLCGLASLPVRLTGSTLAVKCYKQGCGILRFSLLHSYWSRAIHVLLSLV